MNESRNRGSLKKKTAPGGGGGTYTSPLEINRLLVASFSLDVCGISEYEVSSFHQNCNRS